LNAQRNHRSQYWRVEKGNIWRSEAFDIAKTGSEPVVEVCTAKCRLQRFQKEYAINYKRNVREKHVRKRQEALVLSNLIGLLSRGKL
jgi:hypothetical protein